MSAVTVSERVSGGPPHGVYHVSRLGMWSNDSTGLIEPLASTSNTRACSVPTSAPSPKAATHWADSGAVVAVDAAVERDDVCVFDDCPLTVDRGCLGGGHWRHPRIAEPEETFSACRSTHPRPQYAPWDARLHG